MEMNERDLTASRCFMGKNSNITYLRVESNSQRFQGHNYETTLGINLWVKWKNGKFQVLFLNYPGCKTKSRHNQTPLSTKEISAPRRYPSRPSLSSRSFYLPWETLPSYDVIKSRNRSRVPNIISMWNLDPTTKDYYPRFNPNGIPK